MAKAHHRGQVLRKLHSHSQSPPLDIPLLTPIPMQYDLPKEARAYVDFIEEFIGVRVGWIGTGPKREDMIARTKWAGVDDE